MTSINTRFFQPHCRLADNIVSHAISTDKASTIYKNFSRYEHARQERFLRTQYFYENLVYTLERKSSKLEVVFPVSAKQHPQLGDLEYVQQNRFPVSLKKFPMQLKYDHERQSVICAMKSGNYCLELEALVADIRSYEQRQPLLDKHFLDLISDTENVFSLSFRLMLAATISEEEKQTLLDLVA